MQIQLAQKPKNLNISYPVNAEIKYDGVRTIVIKRDGKVQLITRNKKTFKYPRLEEILSHLPDNVVLDGEMIYEDGKSIYRPKISGIVNSAIHGGDMWDDKCGFVAYDMLSYEEFAGESCVTKQHERWWELNNQYSLLSQKFTNPNDMNIFSIVYKQPIHSQEELQRYYDSVFSLGFEGLIVKDPNAYYMFKRHKSWLKMKNESECTLTCVEVKEGTGKYEGMLGALICEGAVKGNKVRVSVGSGLKDGDRVTMQGWVGKSIVVKYNSMVKDQRTGQHSLFLPIYSGRFG